MILLSRVIMLRILSIPILGGREISRFVNLSGKLLGAPPGSCWFDCALDGSNGRYLSYPATVLNLPMYRQGLILLPHLATLGFGVGADGQIIDNLSLLCHWNTPPG